MSYDKSIRILTGFTVLPWLAMSVIHLMNGRLANAGLCVSLGIANVFIYLVG